MKVYKVLKEISIDAGFATFTLHPNDYFYFTDYITNIFFTTKWDNKESESSLKLNKDKLRVLSSIRIDNQTGWTPLSRCIGKEIEDITIQYNRDIKLNQLL